MRLVAKAGAAALLSLSAKLAGCTTPFCLPVQVVDLLVSNRPTYFGLLENPVAAHTA